MKRYSHQKTDMKILRREYIQSELDKGTPNEEILPVLKTKYHMSGADALKLINVVKGKGMKESKFEAFLKSLNEERDKVGEVLKMWSNPGNEVEDIVKATGLTKKQIKNILKKNSKRGWESIED